MARHPEGSAPKLTDELIERLSSAIKCGVYIETAAAYCGISKDTLYRWLRGAQNEPQNPIFKKLSDALQRAVAESEMHDLEIINKAAENGDWKAAAWRLERRFPARWGKSSRFEVKHAGRDATPQPQVIVTLPSNGRRASEQNVPAAAPAAKRK